MLRDTDLLLMMNGIHILSKLEIEISLFIPVVCRKKYKDVTNLRHKETINYHTLAVHFAFILSGILCFTFY